jgi:hypothetical protein
MNLIVYTVLIASLACVACGYYPMLIPLLLWHYIGRFGWREPKRIFNHLLGRWREHRHGAKCFSCDRRTAVWFGKNWLPLCGPHYDELMEVRSTYTENPVSD